MVREIEDLHPFDSGHPLGGPHRARTAGSGLGAQRPPGLIRWARFGAPARGLTSRWPRVEADPR